jgi:hypothetical protein
MSAPTPPHPHPHPSSPIDTLWVFRNDTSGAAAGECNATFVLAKDEECRFVTPKACMVYINLIYA